MKTCKWKRSHSNIDNDFLTDLRDTFFNFIKKNEPKKAEELYDDSKEFLFPFLNQALYISSGFGYLNLIKYFLKNGADINYLHRRDGTYNNLLHIAASYGRVDIVKFLLEKGLDINSMNKFGKTALNIAKDWGHRDLINFLYQHNKKPPPVINIQMDKKCLCPWNHILYYSCQSFSQEV
jgi:hypothetical protein